MKDDINKNLVPDVLKGYDYQKIENDSSSNLHGILQFFVNLNLKIETSELLKAITTDIMVNYLINKGYKEIPSKDTGEKHNGGRTAIYRYFIQEGDNEDDAIGVIDYNNPHNKSASNVYINGFIKNIAMAEDRQEMDVLLELLSMLPKDKA
ncbi:MAG: hypothetical protein WC606_02295 [Candidatus Absconditabacterales bacterium]